MKIFFDFVTEIPFVSLSESVSRPVKLGEMQELGMENVSRVRVLAVLVALVPIVLLATASRLTPNPEGLGTHQQLGLPPCTSRVLLGIRCPACGMTTSWAYFMHGQWIQSVHANSGGFLLAIGSCCVVFVAACKAIWVELKMAGYQKNAALVAIGILAITIADWAFRLASE